MHLTHNSKKINEYSEKRKEKEIGEKENMNQNFKGVYAVVVTPFKKDGSFDIEAAKAHLDWLIQNGIKGVCILGATGEYQSISNEEHKAYVKEIIPYIKERVSVLVGVSRERPEEVVELMENAKNYGANAGMALSPFYCHPDQNEIAAFYQYINDHTELPVVVYNNPGSAGVDISAEVYAEVLRLSNAKIVKESTGDVRRLTEVLNLVPDGISVLCGCDNMAYESLACGAHGWISMAANFAPKDCVELYESIVEKKDFETARKVYNRLLPALNVLESFPKPVQAIKYVLKYVKGIESGYVRRPRLELSNEEKEYILDAMKVEKLQ